MAEPGSTTTSNLYVKKNFNNLLEFLLSCLATTIGLGNFWRFPYSLYDSGGGAFLIPYVIIVVTVGRPMYYLDLAMGQWSGKGSIGMYERLAPGWIGIGIVQTLTSIVVIIYYAFILAIVIFYFGVSFTKKLPWTYCRKEWENCYEMQNGSSNISEAHPSSMIYLNDYVLMMADNVDHGIGLPDWRMTLALLVVWILAFFYLLLGMKSFAKLSYFTALFPYLILFILLVKALTLPGSLQGVLFLFKPNWSKLLELEVWTAALMQCLFSMAIGAGNIAMYASYNQIHSKFGRVAWFIAFADPATSLLCAITVFSALGNLAFKLNKKIDEILIGGGMLLAFVSFPEALAAFDTIPYVFAVVFFFMFFVLGLGSLCSSQAIITTNMLELYPKFKEWQVSAITSLIGFGFGTMIATPGGQVVFTILDRYGFCYQVAFAAIFQILIIAYGYGLRNWCFNVEYMQGGKVSYYYRWTWGIFTPLVLIPLYIISLSQETGPKYRNQELPTSALVCSYVLLVLVSSPVPLSILGYVIKFKREGMTYKEAWKKTFSFENWWPVIPGVAERAKAHLTEKLENDDVDHPKSYSKKFCDALIHRR